MKRVFRIKRQQLHAGRFCFNPHCPISRRHRRGQNILQGRPCCAVVLNILSERIVSPHGAAQGGPVATPGVFCDALKEALTDGVQLRTEQLRTDQRTRQSREAEVACAEHSRRPFVHWALHPDDRFPTATSWYHPQHPRHLERAIQRRQLRDHHASDGGTVDFPRTSESLLHLLQAGGHP